MDVIVLIVVLWVAAQPLALVVGRVLAGADSGAADCHPDVLTAAPRLE